MPDQETLDGRPRFELRRVAADGDESVMLYSLRELAGEFTQVALSRRGFLGLSAFTAATLIAACSSSPEESCKSLRADGDSINCLAFSADAGLLASGGSAVRLWTVKDRLLKRVLWRPKASGLDQVESVAFSPDGQLVAAGYRFPMEKPSVLVWRVADGSLLHSLSDELTDGSIVAFSPDGLFLATGGSNVRLWRVRDWGLEQEFKYGHGPVSFSQDGALLALVQFGQFAVSPVGRRVESDDRLGETSGGTIPRDVQALALGPDGRMLLSGERAVGQESKYTLRLWGVADKKQVRELGTDPGNPLAVAFSPDGTLVASGNTAGIILRQTSDGAVTRQLPFTARTGDSPSSASAVAFSRDLGFAAVGTRDGIVELWDLSRGSLTGCLDDEDVAHPRSSGSSSGGSSGGGGGYCSCNKVCTCIPVRKYCFVMFK